MMNPWTILAAILVVFALVFGAERFGHSNGMNQQKVADQIEFDRIDKERADQKAEANALYRGEQAKNIALLADRDRFKTTLENEREINRVATSALRHKYDSLGLRFAAAKGSGNRTNGDCAQSAGTNTAESSPAETIQLPDALARALRQDAADADDLNDDYKQCYSFAQQVKRVCLGSD